MARTLILSIDAMGGDFAPQSVIDGCVIARVRHPNVKFILHGPAQRIMELLQPHGELRASCEVRDASDVVGMHDKPSQALRRGRTTSMWRALESVRHHEADVAVSAGNTGALMAMAKFQLRPMEGIVRPAIVAIWPTMRGQSVVLDVGANIGSDPLQLVDFAVMGGAFARAVFGLNRPTLGLLNIGTEEIKGNEAVKTAAKLLKESRALPFDFKGFVEGDDISAGTVDVVVTDGFTGNVALKAAEGTARLIAHYLRSALTRSFFAKIGAFLARGAFSVLRTKMDPRSVNGGVFLGLNGVVVKSHGGTDGLGFASAVDLAVEMARNEMPRRIAEDLKTIAPIIAQLQTQKPRQPVLPEPGVALAP
ncbi:MAG: phosphate acyltransferase PlsX [Alphaproteobacteria bacterium]|nr:phosphate acyltransferase PlsX [Alphaproteobacteria bacterium]